MGGRCDCGPLLRPIEERIMRSYGVEIADGQPLCVYCGCPLRRNKRNHAKWDCPECRAELGIRFVLDA